MGRLRADSPDEESNSSDGVDPHGIGVFSRPSVRGTYGPIIIGKEIAARYPSSDSLANDLR